MDFTAKCSYLMINKYQGLYSRKDGHFLVQIEKKSFNCKRLQDICLYSVIKHFKSIMQEYVKNEEEKKQEKKFEILQCYSKTIFDSLLFLRDPIAMEEPYVNFLVNCHIQKLDLSTCGRSNITGLLKALKLVGHTIISVNLSGKNLNLEIINYLFSLMSNLKTVHLDFVTAKSHSLGIICEKCPRIKNYFLRCMNTVTDDSIRLLCPFSEVNAQNVNPNIEILDCVGTEVTIDGIKFALKHFPSLKLLRHLDVAKALHLLHYDDLIHGNLENLPKYNLQEINICSDFEIAEILQICVILCPNLKRVSVDNICSSLVVDCLSLLRLEEVQLFFNIDFNVVCPKRFFDLQMDSLEMIHITSAQFSIASLSRCQKLQKLNLAHPVFEDFDESLKPSLSIFPHLTKLKISNTDLSDNVLKCVLFIMSSCPLLKKLTLQSIFSFSVNALDSILNCDFVTNLCELNLSFSNVTVSAIDKILLLLPRLNRLVIIGCGIPESECSRLLKLYANSIEIVWK